MGTTTESARAADAARDAVKSKVFVSYSRRDQDFADMLAADLEAHGVDALIDREDIVKGEAWRERIYALIGQADTVVFLISPASVSSPICQEEVDYAESLNKRFLPVLVREPLDENGQRLPVPEPLARINYVNFTKGAGDKGALDDLVNALLMDLDWVREHTRLGERALKWQRDGEPTSQLLRGGDLDAAEAWRDSHQKDHRPPTELHLKYISESRKHAGRRRNVLVGSLAAGLVMAIALGAYGWWQKDRAETALLHGARTANDLVSSLAQRFRGQTGIPQSLVADILNRSKGLADNLMQLDSDSEALQLGRGAALAELSDTYLTLGQDAEARATAEQAVVAFKHLVDADPHDTKQRLNLASAYVRLGDVNRTTGHEADALSNYENARSVLDDLAVKGRTAEILAVVHERLGAAKLIRQDDSGAMADFKRCLTLRESLPRSDQNQFARSTCHSKIGALAMAQADWDKAAAAFRDALAAAAQVDAQSLATRLDWQRELAAIHHQIGDALWKGGDPAAGLVEFEKDLALTQAVHEADPERADWQEDLVRSHERVGNASYALGKQTEALAAFKASLGIAKSLNVEKSRRDVWQSQLFKMYQNAGLLLMEMKDYEGAVSMGEESVAYFAGQPKDNAPSRERLIQSHQNLSWFALMARAFETALEQSEAAIALAPERLELQINKAHALMFLDRGTDAKAVYVGHRGAELPDPSSEGTIPWEQQVQDDFDVFRAHDMQHPMMQTLEGPLGLQSEDG